MGALQMVSHKKYTYLIGALGFGLFVFYGVLGWSILSVKHLIFLFMIFPKCKL